MASENIVSKYDAPEKLQKEENNNKKEVVKNINILIIEDSAIIRLSYKITFRNTPYNIGFAKNYNEAISSISKNKYDIILMDIGLKGEKKDSDLLKETRTIGKNIDTKVIAVTGHAKEELKKKSAESFDDYLSKPYRDEDLMNKIKKLIEY